MQQVQSDLLSQNKAKNDDASLSESPSNSPTHQSGCPISTLIIILHGGSLLDVIHESNTKLLDITTFRTTMDSIIQQHYSHLIGRIAIRYINCPPVCLESLLALSSLSPCGVQSSPSSNGDATSHTFDSIPFSALPLFAVSSYEYHENVYSVISQCNKLYLEFLKSDDGKGFSGKVCLIGDSVGSIVGFDALCNGTSPNNLYGSEMSIQNCQESVKSLPSNPIISITDSLTAAEDSGSESPQANSTQKFRTTQGNVSNKPQNKQQVYCKSLSHPGDSSHPDTLNRLYINSVVRRRSSGSSDFSSAKFEFEVNDFFMFGSLIGIVLTYRKMLSLDDKSCIIFVFVCLFYVIELIICL